MHTHHSAEAAYPRPEGGLRSDRLLDHMRAEHGELLAEQLRANDYDADRVSHDWLADVHAVGHIEREEAAILDQAALILRRYDAQRATIAQTEGLARRLRRMS